MQDMSDASYDRTSTVCSSYCINSCINQQQKSSGTVLCLALITGVAVSVAVLVFTS